MKGILDKELEIVITNQLVSYDRITDTLIHNKLSVTKNRKNGYLTFDEKGRNIGIVFMSDDKRTFRYGSAEMLFFKKFENEFGVWRNIKQRGQYLPFERLEKILSLNNQWSLIIDCRLR